MGRVRPHLFNQRDWAMRNPQGIFRLGPELYVHRLTIGDWVIATSYHYAEKEKNR